MSKPVLFLNRQMSETFRLTISENLLSPSVASVATSLICHYERHIKDTEQIQVQCFSRLRPLPSVSSLPFNELWVEHTGNQQEGRL